LFRTSANERNLIDNVVVFGKSMYASRNIGAIWSMFINYLAIRQQN
jgi:hypothetical protein